MVKRKKSNKNKLKVAYAVLGISVIVIIILIIFCCYLITRLLSLGDNDEDALSFGDYYTTNS